MELRRQVSHILFRVFLPRTGRGRQARIEQYTKRGIDLYAAGAYQDSEREFLNAIGVAQEPGASSGLLPFALDRVGDFYHSSGNYSRAEPLYRQSLQLKEQALSENHQQILAGINNLALLYYAEGRNAEAEQLFGRLLGILEKQSGPQGREVATCLENYAAVLRRLDRHPESDELRRRARSIRQANADRSP